MEKRDSANKGDRDTDKGEKAFKAKTQKEERDKASVGKRQRERGRKRLR